jgi:ABC-2 type transport system permease protein
MSAGQQTRAPVKRATPTQVAHAFHRLRFRLSKNVVRSLLRGSRLRLFMILICSAIFWTALFGLFFGGFQFLASYKLPDDITTYIFSLFFLSLLVMLVFSTGIILYTGLYTSREAAYLLTMPATTDRIFAYKFQEAMAFSSWGFMLLGSPMLVAYGISIEAPWPFYAVLLVFLLAFVLIPGSMGAVGAILVAHFFPRRRRTVLVLGAAALVLCGIWLVARVVGTPGDALTHEWLDALLSRLAFSQHPLLPGRWMSVGLIGAARGDWSSSSFYLMVLSAHALLGYLIAAVIARDLYRASYSRVQGGRSSRRRIGWYGLDALLHRAFVFIPKPVRLLILKDLRTFRRDPAQWSQFLIFFGLLASYLWYFASIRSLGFDVQSAYWTNLLSFLNLAVTALILSTFTSRFIFPLLSLEGRNFWVLGLLPLRRQAILWGKFAFSAGISMVAAEVLVVLSDLMLHVGAAMTALHVGTVVVLCLGLSGISVGLGARLPNLKEDDPSKIAVGFGGTLNLLVSLVFIFTIVLTLALPCHIYLAGRQFGETSGIEFSDPRFRSQITLAILIALATGAIGTLVPLRIGITAFEKMEF